MNNDEKIFYFITKDWNSLNPEDFTGFNAIDIVKIPNAPDFTPKSLKHLND